MVGWMSLVRARGFAFAVSHLGHGPAKPLPARTEDRQGRVPSAARAHLQRDAARAGGELSCE